jgi:filamentous hemagglutinin family protein
LTQKYILNTFVGSVLFSLLITFPSEAQVKHDLTLPNNTSIKIEGNQITIEGGTQAGKNIFHSFQEFSLSQGDIATFNNALDIVNIIVRVTGTSASNIDGMISANGSANVFLSNPNGISFGQNARLNIGGSFVATTASAFTFDNGSEFSATNPQSPPLLAINVPVGLRFGSNPGGIQVEGTGQGLITPNIGRSPTVSNSNITGLQVQPGNSLSLVGGDINLKGGILKAEGGTINLGSVSSGVVSLNSNPQGWTLGFEGASNFNNINLSDQSLVNTSGTGFGSINVNGANINVENASILLIQNRGQTSSGSLSINASKSLILKGTSPGGNASSTLTTEALSTGQGGDLKISTPQLVLQDGARIGASTYSEANGGNIIVDASNSVQLLSNKLANPSRPGDIISFISAATFASGNSGSVQVSTNNLLITDGGTIASSAIGSGNGNNITVSANSIEILGKNSVRFAPSTIAASNFNTGKGGSLFINTRELKVKDGGAVNAASLSTGDAGSVNIKADTIDVSGNVNSPSSFISSSVTAANETVRRIFGLPPVPSGSSGSVAISTRILNVKEGGLISVENQGIGNAGQLDIKAESINLDNKASISASTASGEGGNISLEARNVQLRDNSLVTATAKNGQSNGGNVNIKAGTIALLEDSRITANAFEGSGGKITIDTQGLFVSPNSIITASSAKGVNGVVKITAGQINFINAVLIKTAPNPPSTNKLCTSESESEDQFVNRSGGIPASTSDPFNSLSGWEDDRKLNATIPSETSAPLTQTEVEEEYKEAQGWKSNFDGTISFTDISPEGNAYGSLSETPCHSSEKSQAQQPSGESNKPPQ